MSVADPEPSSAPKLVRELGPLDASMIVMGSMIGSGIFITSAESSRLVGTPGWLLVAWGIAGLLTITGALASAEVAAMMPRAGGQFVFLREAYGPAVGFLFGWATFLVVQTGTIAAVAVAFAKFLGVFAPGVSATNYLLGPVHFGNSGYAIGLSTQQLVAVALIAVLTFLNTRGLRTGKSIQNTFTFTKTAALFGLIVVGLCFGANKSSAAWTSSWWDPFANGWKPDGVGTATGITAFVLMLGKSTVGPLFSQSAWNGVTFTGGEVRQPGRTLPFALLVGTSTVVLLYILANVAYVVTLPLDQIQNADQGRVGTAVMKAVLGPAGVSIMAGAIMISTFGCVNGLVLSGARVLYAMARDGLFFKQAATTNARHVPAVALAMQGAWSILLVLPMTVDFRMVQGKPPTATYGNTYNQLLEFLTPVDLTFYMLMVGSVVMLRKKLPGAERPYRTFAYPWPVVIYLTLAGLLVVDIVYLAPGTAGIGYAIALAGIPVYWVRKLAGGANGTGPIGVEE